VPRTPRRTVGSLLLVGALAAAALAGCGEDPAADDDVPDEARSEFCASVDDLNETVTELKGFQLTSEDDVPEAKEKIVAVLDALRAMLAQAPQAIRADAEAMAATLDPIEQRIEDATALELGTEVPALLAQIGGGGTAEANPAAKVNAYIGANCV
jgi:hypothetical protein